MLLTHSVSGPHFKKIVAPIHLDNFVVSKALVVRSNPERAEQVCQILACSGPPLVPGTMIEIFQPGNDVTGRDEGVFGTFPKKSPNVGKEVAAGGLLAHVILEIEDGAQGLRGFGGPEAVAAGDGFGDVE